MKKLLIILLFALTLTGCANDTEEPFEVDYDYVLSSEFMNSLTEELGTEITQSMMYRYQNGAYLFQYYSDSEIHFRALVGETSYNFADTGQISSIQDILYQEATDSFIIGEYDNIVQYDAEFNSVKEVPRNGKLYQFGDTIIDYAENVSVTVYDTNLTEKQSFPVAVMQLFPRDSQDIYCIEYLDDVPGEQKVFRQFNHTTGLFEDLEITLPGFVREFRAYGDFFFVQTQDTTNHYLFFKDNNAEIVDTNYEYWSFISYEEVELKLGTNRNVYDQTGTLVFANDDPENQHYFTGYGTYFIIGDTTMTEHDFATNNPIVTYPLPYDAVDKVPTMIEGVYTIQEPVVHIHYAFYENSWIVVDNVLTTTQFYDDLMFNLDDTIHILTEGQDINISDSDFNSDYRNHSLISYVNEGYIVGVNRDDMRQFINASIYDINGATLFDSLLFIQGSHNNQHSFIVFDGTNYVEMIYNG